MHICRSIHIVALRNNHFPHIHRFSGAGGATEFESATVPSWTLHHPFWATMTFRADVPEPAGSSGALCKLDSVNAYSCHDSDTLYGRACIIATLLPSRSVACSRTAAWVWLGGTFPESIDIIAKAHYRALRYGRKINVFNRLAPNEHTIKVGPIIVTTPVRTACDLALNCTPESESLVSEIICMLMQEFHSAPTIACKSCGRRSIFATRHRRATTFLRSTEEATNMSAAHSRHKARRATHADRIGADRANGFRRLLGIQEKRRPRTHRATHRDARNLAHRAQRTRREPPPYQPNRGRNRWWIRRLPQFH